MILLQEITAMAKELQLEPTTIEKDYVLSWVLYGISKNPQLSQWLFKGGTCLKKCYFETYRFSEDLDFTVPNGAIYSIDEIKNALNEVANAVYEETGINLKRQEIEVEESINKRNNKTYVAKFTYLGPLNLPSRNSQRIKFDISNDEIIVDENDMRDVFHPYTDAPNPSAKVKCYSVNEILAEKTRAIYERQGRARDIYDIVNIGRNFREDVNKDIAKSGLKKKFNFIGISNPSVDLILSQLDFLQLKASWEDQLKHQVEVLPSVDNFYNDLKSALSWWIDEHSIEPTLIAIPNKPNEVTLPRVHFPEAVRQQSNRIGIGRTVISTFSKYVDQIRYAARNRLCIEIEYHGIKRLIEPYSMKQPKTGNQLLYVYEITKGTTRTDDIRSYKINEISGVKVTEQSFSPRYLVEL
jgi:predicted nucleotidyltransferase component of viral defense system